MGGRGERSGRLHVYTSAQRRYNSVEVGNVQGEGRLMRSRNEKENQYDEHMLGRDGSRCKKCDGDAVR